MHLPLAGCQGHSLGWKTLSDSGGPELDRGSVTCLDYS